MKKLSIALKVVKSEILLQYKRYLGGFLLFFLLIVKFLVIHTGLLILLVFGNQIVHVALSFCELHFIHAFTSVPMQEGLTAEHSSELFRDALEQFLNGSRVPNEGGIKHLLGKFGYGQGPVLLATSGCQGGKARNKEMETWERNHVDRQLPEVSIQLTREAEAGGDA